VLCGSCAAVFVTGGRGGGEGDGGSVKSFIRGGPAQRPNPLPFRRPFLTEKVHPSYAFY